MNQAYLLLTASQLRQPQLEAADEFAAHKDFLAAELNRRMGARTDLEKLIGPGNLPMMEDNSRNFVRFMGTLFQGYEPQVLVQTALWVFSAYRAHGFQTTYWAANLDTFLELLRERLSPAGFQALEPFFRWLIVHIPTFTALSDPARAGEQPHGRLS